jgi:hypothetical protein
VKRSVRGLLCVALATAFTLALPAGARAAWSDSNVAVTYGFELSGWDLNTDSACLHPPCPVVMSGVFKADGSGNVTSADISIYVNSDVCFHAPLDVGFYTVNSDGTGNISVSWKTGGSFCPAGYPISFITGFFALSKGGLILELSVVGSSASSTSPGAVLSGVARKLGGYN